MKQQKCTGSFAQAVGSDYRHEIEVTEAVFEACSMAEMRGFLIRHWELDCLPCGFAADSGPKVMVETAQDGSRTLVFLADEREEAVKGRRMRELNAETALA